MNIAFVGDDANGRALNLIAEEETRERATFTRTTKLESHINKTKEFMRYNRECQPKGIGIDVSLLFVQQIFTTVVCCGC